MTFLMGLTFEQSCMYHQYGGPQCFPTKMVVVGECRHLVCVCECVGEREREREMVVVGVCHRVCQCSALRGEKRSAGPFINAVVHRGAVIES